MSEEQKEQGTSLEEKFSEIELIIGRMEDPQIGLDESFLLYQDGVNKLRECNQMLDTVEKKMQVIREEGQLEDF